MGIPIFSIYLYQVSGTKRCSVSYPLHAYLLCVAIASLVVAGTAHAQEVYKWTDQSGTTHYGELPPPLEFSSFEVLEVQLQEPVSANGDESYRAALAVANSLQADRLEREKLRLEKDRLAQQERQARWEAQRYNETYRSQNYNDGYYYPYRRYPHRPYYGKPNHPQYPMQGQGSSVKKRVYLGR